MNLLSIAFTSILKDPSIAPNVAQSGGRIGRVKTNKIELTTSTPTRHSER